MEDIAIARHLENLDRRLTNVEQILPTLATKEDLRKLATKEELQATKEELRDLAAKEELRALTTSEEIRLTREELRAQGERLQRHIDVVGEALRSDIQLLAEHLASVMPRGTGTAS